MRNPSQDDLARTAFHASPDATQSIEEKLSYCLLGLQVKLSSLIKETIALCYFVLAFLHQLCPAGQNSKMAKTHCFELWPAWAWFRKTIWTEKKVIVQCSIIEKQRDKKNQRKDLLKLKKKKLCIKMRDKWQEIR